MVNGINIDFYEIISYSVKCLFFFVEEVVNLGDILFDL